MVEVCVKDLLHAVVEVHVLQLLVSVLLVVAALSLLQRVSKLARRFFFDSKAFFGEAGRGTDFRIKPN